MKQLRVLLADDEIMIREGFRRLFDWEAHGCVLVGEAADGMEALTQINALLPDLVIMDINIPVMNGLQVIQTCRAKYPQMAFIIVSGYDDFSYCREALRLQVTDYMLKPVDYEEFGLCIDKLRISMFEQELEHSKTDEGQETPIRGMIGYMQEHLAEEISLQLLAEEFHLSAQYISQLFKNEMGVNYLTYLTNIRVEHAKRLLIGSKLPISDIAEHSGYADYRVFSKVFKKVQGITPTQYRREFAENGTS